MFCIAKRQILVSKTLAPLFKRSITISKFPDFAEKNEENFKPPFIPLTSDTGFPGAVGNTPLLKIVNLSKEIGRNIYAKGEFMNPGGSVKGMFFYLFFKPQYFPVR